MSDTVTHGELDLVTDDRLLPEIVFDMIGDIELLFEDANDVVTLEVSDGEGDKIVVPVNTPESECVGVADIEVVAVTEFVAVLDTTAEAENDGKEVMDAVVHGELLLLGDEEVDKELPELVEIVPLDEADQVAIKVRLASDVTVLVALLQLVGECVGDIDGLEDTDKEINEEFVGFGDND